MVSNLPKILYFDFAPFIKMQVIFTFLETHLARLILPKKYQRELTRALQSKMRPRKGLF